MCILDPEGCHGYGAAWMQLFCTPRRLQCSLPGGSSCPRVRSRAGGVGDQPQPLELWQGCLGMDVSPRRWEGSCDLSPVTPTNAY